MTMRGHNVALTVCVLGLAACEPMEPLTAAFNDRGVRAEDSGRWQPGLATSYNATLLADDPADFDHPRHETPRDSARRDAAISAYRANRGASMKGTSTQQSGGRP